MSKHRWRKRWGCLTPNPWTAMSRTMKPSKDSSLDSGTGTCSAESPSWNTRNSKRRTVTKWWEYWTLSSWTALTSGFRAHFSTRLLINSKTTLNSTASIKCRRALSPTRTTTTAKMRRCHPSDSCSMSTQSSNRYQTSTSSPKQRTPPSPSTSCSTNKFTTKSLMLWASWLKSSSLKR